MPRNNAKRTRSAPTEETPEVSEAPAASVLDFVSPTELVDLPSRGRFYHEDHPLYNQETVEIRYMTAKDEDILTSQTLLKRGVALERLMQNVLVDKSVKPGDLLIGDRSALLVAARITGYGAQYKTQITCPSCGEASQASIDLKSLETLEGSEEDQEELGVTSTDRGTFTTQLPLTGITAEFRLLTGADETAISKHLQRKRNKEVFDGSLSTQFSRAIVALDVETKREIIQKFVLMMPAADARHLRNAFKVVSPSLDMTHDFECTLCGHEDEVEVPLTADFFWPQ